MTAQTSKPWRSYFLMWHSRREADHCADSAFPYLYYRRQHADCQAPEGIAIRRFLWYPYLQERRCSASAAVMLPSSVSLFVSSSGGSPIFCHPPDGSNVSTWKSKGGFHYGNFEYCYCSARPSGHCHPWHCQNHLDDCPSLFSGYASRKTLYQKIKWQEKWPPL